jgi:hypothetical protein
MDNPSRLHSISNLRAIGLMAGALVLMPAPLLAADATNVRATGTMPPTAVVDVPSQIVSDPPTLKADGTEMIVSSQTPVGLIANVPSQVALTSLELAAPQGVSSANVGAELSLMENGRALVGTSTTGSSEGSSEGCMLGGLVMKWHWRQRRRAAGLEGGSPNLVMGSNTQIYCVHPVQTEMPPSKSRYVIDGMI